MLIIRLASRTRLIACRELDAPSVVVDDWVVGCFWQGVPIRNSWIDTLNQNLKVHTKVITTFGELILSHLYAVNQGPTCKQCFIDDRITEIHTFYSSMQLQIIPFPSLVVVLETNYNIHCINIVVRNL